MGGMEHLHVPASLPSVEEMIADAKTRESQLVAQVGFEHTRRQPVVEQKQPAVDIGYAHLNDTLRDLEHHKRNTLGRIYWIANSPTPTKSETPQYKKLPRRHVHKTTHTPKVTKHIVMGRHKKG